MFRGGRRSQRSREWNRRHATMPFSSCIISIVHYSPAVSQTGHISIGSVQSLITETPQLQNDPRNLRKRRGKTSRPSSPQKTRNPQSLRHSRASPAVSVSLQGFYAPGNKDESEGNAGGCYCLMSPLGRGTKSSTRLTAFRLSGPYSPLKRTCLATLS